MCCTVASRLYLRGQRTSIESSGGIRLPSDKGLLPELPLFKFDEIELAAESLAMDPPLSVLESLASLGSANFIGGPGTDGSGMKEEADDRSERRLLVRAADLTDGSELAEETEGDSRPISGDDACDNGDCRYSGVNFGCRSIGIVGIFGTV
jgi:hypothetical protein